MALFSPNFSQRLSVIRDTLESPAMPPSTRQIEAEVRATLFEDLVPEGGIQHENNVASLLSKDRTASLIASDASLSAELHLKEPARICGQAWFDAAFRYMDPGVEIQWHVAEGEDAVPGIVATLKGAAAAMLCAERSALNWLQTLTGTATQAREWARRLEVASSGRTRLLDTRKTIPGLRIAQKYATRVGGVINHRLGVWDAVLIKENHIAACGSIRAAVECARERDLEAARLQAPAARWIEVETESLDEVQQALDAGADWILFDEFPLPELTRAVQMTRGRAIAEASGDVTPERFGRLAGTGIEFLSSGALTKHLRATDFSLRYRGTAKVTTQR
ncbi:MAG: carboxylating nicotinate-nucleotide diphosphorylase [Thioalkalivibrionaceae bacterium]